MASYYDYAGKALKPRFAITSPGEVPSVSEVHPSVDGTGLEVSGWFATWAKDSDGEAFLPTAFDTAAPAALAVGLPVLYAHAKNEVPVGFVKSMEVRPAGLWGSIILPAPLAGTKAAEIYEAVKAKILDKFSVGGFWLRKTIGGRIKLLCDRLVEVSLTATPTNLYARAASVSAVRGVKSVGGRWLPTAAAYELKSIMGELGGLEYLRDGLLAEQRQAQEMDDLSYLVARATLGLRSR
jgi:HK97 family phage prohead protease